MTNKPIKLASIKADLEREKKGAWIPYPDWPGAEFNVSSLHLPEYETARDLLFQRLRAEYKGTIPKTVLVSELGRLYSIHILHDWKGFDIEYGADVAAKILADPEYRDLVTAIEWCAGKVSESNIQFVEAEVKNSGKPSARG